ncbi:MAG: hypothetical protein EOM19_06770 [Candidatus Moranbacteria bacterium]|nr:hypothetical protein [Candidatus Moranbacteria bacterium]
MILMKKKTFILKIGGSVLTKKNAQRPSVRKKILEKIVENLKRLLANEQNLRLILIHGAGSGGHTIAHTYNLSDGVYNDPYKRLGALKVRRANQVLNEKIFSMFIDYDIPVIPLHSGSLLATRKGNITYFSHTIIDLCFKNKSIPLLYGEMVFDEESGMSVCSGDLIAFYLAKKYNASRVLFASDVEGIYSEDPFKNKNASLIKNSSLRDLVKNKKITLSGSHNIDVTGGIYNKIQSLKNNISPSIQDVIIFNGLHPENFLYITKKNPPGTKILLS